MQTLDRWNYEKRCYEAYSIPQDWDVSTSLLGPNPINCAGCGARASVDEVYISLEIHTPIGFGYYVCEICHEAELKRKLRAAENHGH